MSNGSPAVAAASSSAGGGIAFLRRQFELRVDPLYETPMKPMVRKRPVSFIDPKAIKTGAVDASSSVRPAEHVQPKPRDVTTSLSELAASDPCHDPSTSSSSLSTSSSSSASSSKTIVDAAAGVDRASQNDANDGQAEEIQDKRGEGTSNDVRSHSHDLELTPTPPFHPSDVSTSKDINDSSAELTQAELNDKHETKDISLANDGSKETNSSTACLNSNAAEFNLSSVSACKPESLNGVLKTGMKRGKDAQQAEHDVDRRHPDETLPSEQKSPNSKTYLSSSNATPKKTWMPVTRSLENLCSDSVATPTKESTTFCEKKPNDILLSAKATVDAVTTSQSLDRSTSLATKAKPPVRAKKPPPPPVPKKNVKFAVASKSHRAVDDGAKEDSNSSTKILSSEEGSSSTPSSEATTGSEGGGEGDQSQRSLLRRSATTSTKVTRPTSFFPPMQQQPPAVRRVVESAVDYDRYKSLPTLSQGESPVCNRKDTMFPSNRQKLRPQVLTAESGHVGGSAAALTPEFYQRSLVGDSQLLLASPMSLGNRTPPGIDSVIANPEEHSTDHRQSSVSSNGPLPTPIDSDGSHSMRVRTPDALLPSPSSDLETFDMSSAAEPKQASDSNQLSEISDADSFLDDTFEFLGCDEQHIEANISPLKLWTDTWCKSSTKNNSEIPLPATTKDSKINDSQKGIEISTIDDIKDQDRTEKNRLNTTAKKEEDKQRTTDDKQDLKRRGSAIRADRKVSENAKDVDTIERPKLFGVVLRTNSSCSLARRSTTISAIPNTSATNASSSPSSSSSSSSAAATFVRDRRSTALVRTPSDARSLSRLSSLTSLTILPSNRPVAKVPGKYIGGKPSIILDGSNSMMIQEDKKTDIEMELDAIEKAFDFLDGSGA